MEFIPRGIPANGRDMGFMTVKNKHTGNLKTVNKKL